MKGKRMVSLVFMFFVVFLTGLIGSTWAGSAPEGVSPALDSQAGSVAVVGNACPTFSWSAVEGTSSYRVEVYEMITSEVMAQEDMAKVSSPIIVKDTGLSLSWTPSSAECLKDGARYVWYVGRQGTDEEGQVWQWSEGKVFEVNLLSSQQEVDAIKETLQGYLTNEWTKTDSYVKVKEEIKKEITEGKAVSGSSADNKIGIMSYEGTSNTLYGTGAGNSLGDDDDSATFIGYRAGYNTNDGTGWPDGKYNTFVGYHAGYSNTIGYDNTFIGKSAGYYNTTGYSNTFMGLNAGYKNTTGNYNTFMGRAAGYSNTTGSNNTFIGRAAGFKNTTGSGNVFLGYTAGYNETGSNKLYIDNSDTSSPLIYGEFDNNKVKINGSLGAYFYGLYTSGDGLTTPIHISSNNTASGKVSDTGFSLKNEKVNFQWNFRTAENSQGFMVTKQGTGGAEIEIRNTTSDYTNVSMHMGNGSYNSSTGQWINASSRQYKEGIKPLSVSEAMEAFKGLNPVKFRFKNDPDGKATVGFIAEEVPELVATKDRKGLSALEIVAVLTRVVKEQETEINKQTEEINKQTEEINKLKEKTARLEAENEALKAELKDRIIALERQLKLMNSVASR